MLIGPHSRLAGETPTTAPRTTIDPASALPVLVVYARAPALSGDELVGRGLGRRRIRLGLAGDGTPSLLVQLRRRANANELSDCVRRRSRRHCANHG